MFFVAAIAYTFSCIFQSYFVSTSTINLPQSGYPLNEYFKTSESYDTNGFLDRRYFSNKDHEIIHKRREDEKNKYGSNKALNYNLDNKSSKRQLIRYNFRNVVHCLDSLFIKGNRPVNITFIGDSIMRNQFRNFISFIPDYDRISSIKISDDDRTVRYQKDNYVRSEILNDLLVSFQWHAIINGKLISIFNLWGDSEDYQTPDFIFLGSTVHNMLKELYNLNHRSFLENLELDLLPAILNYLRVHPQKQIIWMLQTPSTDLLAPISLYSYNEKIHIKKIQDYNNIVRRVFKGTRVLIWDSLLPAAEEYIRSCALQMFHHADDTVYEYCIDSIHFGNRILSIGSQLIYNHLCNV
ncbi:uncharacterized protein LOC124330272 [Daphnia pulicaria]|uniref:uncharacterized protein LOC124330272 n=1 Tax=Daphnia pulicaria TaxID=35523 RepID=UPI001EEBA721|nr:uncharacterized protein LOC124330272 [Daphnia pulicaria]XP_046644656.1 uncharacterized protein LOC124330272 [Daphnia pulicaria]